MSHQSLVTSGPPHISPSAMLKDHKRVVQNYVDSLRARGLSASTIASTSSFIEHWFEKIRVHDANGERQLCFSEAMKPFEGRKRIKDFLTTLSAVDDNNQVCLRATTVRAYAGILERFFICTLESPFIEGLQTISSKYGPIENPFTGVEYPLHSTDQLRSEKFFLTPEQILELLIFMRELYPRLTRRSLTAGRLYTIVVLITETGMRSVELLNLDAQGDDRDIFYDREVIQTRFGKGRNSSGPLTRLMPLTAAAAVTLKQYEREVRPQFRNHLTDPALFLSTKGKRLSYIPLREGFTRLIKSARKHGANLPPNLTVHDLRASFATNFIEANPDQFWELMEQLGHVSPSSTLLYIRSRGKNRWLSMKEARGPRLGRTGFGPMVYNR
jgi:integrase